MSLDPNSFKEWQGFAAPEWLHDRAARVPRGDGHNCAPVSGSREVSRFDILKGFCPMPDKAGAVFVGERNWRLPAQLGARFLAQLG